MKTKRVIQANSSLFVKFMITDISDHVKFIKDFDTDIDK